MTRLAAEYGAVNLAQGYPDFACPKELKVAASEALFADYNQYSVTWGAPELRAAIAKKAQSYNHLSVDPKKNVVVTCGTTEAMVASQLALLDPGDELIVMSPHYENYAPDAVISGARPKYFPLREEAGFALEEEALKKQFSSKTKGIVLNNPMNPTGKVFSLKELKLLGDLCADYNVTCFSDEIYEYILYDEAKHVSIGSLDSMRERTVTISGFSKTFGVTGWRVGYALASEQIINAVKKLHDFLTVGAPHPLQIACAQALSLPGSYYTQLRKEYRERRDLLLSRLESLGFRCFQPEGAYYIWCDFSPLDPEADDVAFARRLVKHTKVAVVPGSSFYAKSNLGNKRVRFTFSKKLETLEEACRRLEKLHK